MLNFGHFRKLLPLESHVVLARTRILLSSVCLLVSGALVAPASAQPPTTARSTTTLCVGYAGCAAAGMGNGGYSAESGKMWWRMYAGHNCTNYAAYRMVKAGLPNIRPWTGSGNASNWGPANPKIRDSVPTVGAIAWWAANRPPAGSSGHVAYVEKVVSDSEIIVSQDSWGGTFSWARITRSSGRWPTGFLHFKVLALTNTALPTVSGTPRVGSTLTATGGVWTPAAATVTYEWRANGESIPGATSATFVPGLAQQGKQISVVATATAPGYPASAVGSAPTAPVEPGEITNTVAPAIVGLAQVDSTLTPTPGSWTPEPTRLLYRWFANGKPIRAATKPTLTPVPALVGKNLTVRVTARKDGYGAVRAIVPTSAPVAPGTFTVLQPPVVTGTTLPGETLALDPGSYAPAAPGEVSVAWLRNGAPVDGATGTTYPLTAADLGSSLTAQVTVARPGYETLSATTAATEPVKARPHLLVERLPGTRRVRLAITVTADGVNPVTGTLTVSRGRVQLAAPTLRRGTARVLLPELRPGARTVLLRYDGSDTVLGTVLRQSVTFP
jgi:surface antigen